MSSDGFFARIAELQEAGNSVAVATVVRTSGSVPRREGARMLIHPDGRIEGTVGGGDLEGRVIRAALETLEDGDPKSLHYEFRDIAQGDVGVCGGEVEVFVEAVRPSPTVVVVGGGHVGSSVAYLAHWLGFRVVVSDDRPEFATPEAVPGADQYIETPLADLPDKITITPETYILLTTRGMPVDVDGLPSLLDSEAGYIGVIGSKRRWDTCAQQLAERGIPQEKIARVVSPMGLELNAETPEEIAISMLAEIIMLRRGGSGEPMAHAPKIRKQA